MIRLRTERKLKVKEQEIENGTGSVPLFILVRCPTRGYLLWRPDGMKMTSQVVSLNMKATDGTDFTYPLYPTKVSMTKKPSGISGIRLRLCMTLGRLLVRVIGCLSTSRNLPQRKEPSSNGNGSPNTPTRSSPKISTTSCQEISRLRKAGVTLPSWLYGE